MNIDLTDIYDKDLGANDDKQSTPIPTKKKEYDVTELYSEANPRLGGQVSHYNPDEYTGYLNEPLYEAKGDPNIRRGLAQSGWEQFGNFLAQTGVKTLTQLGEGLGYMGSLVTEWGDERDYSNGLTEASKSASNWMDKNFPLYRHNTDTFALNDSAWWAQNLQGLISSVGAFAIEGAGFGALVNASRVAKGMEALSGLSKVGRVSAKLVGEKVAETMTAGMLAYTEGAMSGKRVFDEVYQAEFKKGIIAGKSAEEADSLAKHAGAQAASTAVQLNTIMNTGFGMFQGVGEFFNHTKNNVIQTAKKNLFMTVDEVALGAEGLQQYSKRLASTTAEALKDQLKTGKSWSTIGREAVGEGMEELTNQFAERTGIEEGKAGNIHGFIGQLGQMSKYFDRTMDTEGALNFVMGAIAGPIQHGLANNLPLHKQIEGVATNDKEQMLDESGQITEDYNKAKKNYVQGKFTGNRVSKRTLNQFGANTYFNDIKSKITEDVTNMQSIQESISKAVQDNDPVLAEKLRTELFNAGNTNAASMGFAHEMTNTYRSLQNIDNTITEKEDLTNQVNALQEKIKADRTSGIDVTEQEQQLNALMVQRDKASDKTAAMKLNLTDSKENNDYKTKAKEAIETLEDLQKIHDDVQKKYGSPDDNMNELQGHVSDHIFEKKANLYHLKKYKESLEKQLNELDLSSTPEDEGDVTIYGRRVNRLAEKHEGLKKDFETLEAAEKSKDYSNVAPLIKKYGAIGVTDADNPKAVKDLKGIIAKEAQEAWDSYNQEKESLINSPMYEKWSLKNPTKSFEEFLSSAMKNKQDSMLQKQIARELGSTESQIKTYERFVNELESTKTLSSVIKKTEAMLKEAAKGPLELLKIAMEEKTTREIAEKQRREHNIEVMRNLKDRYAQEKKDIKKQLNKVLLELRQLKKDIKAFVFSTSLDPYKFEELKLKKVDLEHTIKKLRNRLIVLDSLWEEADTALDEYITPVEVKNEEAPPSVEPNPEESTEPPVDEEAPAPVEEVPEAPVPTPALEQLQIVLQQIPASSRPAVLAKYQDLRAGQKISLDSLNGVNLGTFTSPQVITALRDALKEEGVLIADIDEAITEVEVLETVLPDDTEASEEIPEEASKDMVHDGFESNDLPPTEADRNSSSWDTKKQRDPHNSLAGKTITTEEVANAAGNMIFTNEGKIEKSINPDTVDPGKLKPGMKVKLVVDTDSEFINDFIVDGVLNDDIDNIPIKIVDESGKTIQWLHTVDWVLEAIENSDSDERFKHTVNVIRDSEGNIITDNNAEEEADRLFSLRKLVIDAYKNGTASGFETTIIAKGPGTLSFNQEGTKAIQALPEVKLGIVRGKSILGVGSEKINPTRQLSNWNGKTIAMIPMADGTHTPITLRGEKLSDVKGAYGTMVRVTELHLDPTASGREEEIKTIEDATGFNIKTLDGYRNFIIQYYTFITNLTELDKVKSGIVLHAGHAIAGETSNYIAIAQRVAGSMAAKPVVAVLENGQLSTDFKKALKNLLDIRYKSVALASKNLKGINSEGAFTEISYDSKAKAWTAKENKSYTEYAKKFLYSNVKFLEGDQASGKLTMSDGKGRFIFAANPIIKIDTNLKASPVKVNTTMIDDTAPALGPSEVEIRKDWEEELKNEIWNNSGTKFTGKSFVAKDGNTYTIEESELKSGDKVIKVKDKDGKTVSSAYFTKNEDGTYSIKKGTRVESKIQGIGLASAIYNYFDNNIGKIKRTDTTTDEGDNLWNSNKNRINAKYDAELKALEQQPIIPPNQAILNEINGTTLPVDVVGTSAESTPITRKQVEDIYNKLQDEMYEAGEDIELNSVDDIYTAAKANNWTIDMIESKIKCGS